MIEVYEHSKHYLTICEWLAARGIPKPDRTLLSDTGIVVNRAAVGFLFMTNSKQCYLDHVAADPKASKEERDEALNILFDAIQDLAAADGYTVMIALSNLSPVNDRLTKHGFKTYKDFTLYYKLLVETRRIE